MSTTMESADLVTDEYADAGAFAERMLQAALGWADLLSAYLGEQLGWYRSLVDDGPSTPDELAARTGTSPRYAREWLEQQAVSGVLRLETADGGQRRYSLPAGAAEVLTDDTSLAYFAPFARIPSVVSVDRLVEACRTGGGVSWAELGDVARTAQAQLNRPWFAQLPGAFASIDAVHATLSQPGARIADVGAGGGWSSISLAQAYPNLRVVGVDVDGPSVELGRENAASAEVADRVRFIEADGDALAEHGPFDAAFAFECLHDMPRPVEVLAAMREAVPTGPVIIMDEAVGEQLVAPGDPVERLMYALSLTICLPDGLSHSPSAGTGTVMRPGTLREYARAAGFSAVEVLPIEDFGFFRFYSLVR